MRILPYPRITVILAEKEWDELVVKLYLTTDTDGKKDNVF